MIAVNQRTEDRDQKNQPFRDNLRDCRTVNALRDSVNTQKLGIPSTVRSSDDHLIPAQPSIPPSLIEKLAISHALVLEKWNRNFGLDLRWPKRPDA
jgi:hypothetical protein